MEAAAFPWRRAAWAASEDPATQSQCRRRSRPRGDGAGKLLEPDVRPLHADAGEHAVTVGDIPWGRAAGAAFRGPCLAVPVAVKGHVHEATAMQATASLWRAT